MPPQPRRGLPLVLALLLLVAPPVVRGQLDPGAPTVPGAEPVPDPDFVPGGTSVQATHELEPVRVCVRVYNMEGDETTLHRPFDVVLHVDGFEAASARITETLYRGQGAERCWNMTLDPGVHSYHFVVDALDEVREQREDNNVAAQRWFYVDERPKPDLRVELLDVSPRQSRERQPQVMVAYVKNAGNLASPETVLDFSDRSGLLARLPVRALEPGQTHDVVLFTQPDLRAPGDYVLEALVDPEQKIVEWNESNNARVLPYVVSEHPLPNLVVRNLTVEGPRVAGASLHLNATLANLGTKDVPAASRVLVRVYDGDEPIHNETRAPLKLGEEARVRILLRLPEGTHDLRIVADPEGALAETDESDNEAGESLVLAPPRLDPRVPNLVVERLDAMPNDPRPGETVTLVALVRNAADVPVGETLVEFSVNGQRLGSSAAPALEPGRYASVTIRWPANAEGSYTLRAKADAAGAVNESDEDDNLIARTFVVLTPPPPTPPSPGGGAGTGDGGAPGAGNGAGPNGTSPTPPVTPTKPVGGAPGAEGNGTSDAALVIGDVSVSTRAVPGGAKGVAVASLRNARLEPLGRLSVAFKVDGETRKEVLVEGLGAAVTAPVSSGEMDLPPGEHVLSVEVSLVGGGSPQPLASSSRTFEAVAGESETPAPGAALVASAVAGLALALGRRRRSP